MSFYTIPQPGCEILNSRQISRGTMISTPVFCPRGIGTLLRDYHCSALSRSFLSSSLSISKGKRSMKTLRAMDQGLMSFD